MVDAYKGTSEFAFVNSIATRLLKYLNRPATLEALARANQPSSSSQEIQAVFQPFARDLGFRDESVGLFADYETKGLRPDYFLKLGDTGILLEVERGKTTINNMDLLDFWKCHLCGHANYLFLLVPTALRQNDSMSPRNEYKAVCNRLGSFFRPRNYTNVRGLFVFGY